VQAIKSRKSRRRPALIAASVLAALGAEFVDELVDGSKSAALPLIRAGLDLSYGQIGLLAAVPLIAGSLIELPMGILAGTGRRRRWVVLAGGLAFIASLLVAAAASTFAGLLAAFVLFFPASGAFVGLTEAEQLDAAPARRAQFMARWTLAGALGAVAGPLLLAAVVAVGGSWRAAYVVTAIAAAMAWLGLAGTGRASSRGWRRPGSRGRSCAGRAGPGATSPSETRRPGETGKPDAGGISGETRQPGETVEPDAEADPEPAGFRDALKAARSPSVLRWLVLLQVADLLLDVLTGFVALYFVAVAGVSPARAALAVGVRLAADLTGSAVLIPVLERWSGRLVLRASAGAALALYPAFLLVPGFWPKVCVLAALSVVTPAWYPVLQAELYASLPGRSGVAVSLNSAATLAGGLGPLAVGYLAGWLGLGWALAGLVIVPACVLAGSWPGVGLHSPLGPARTG
jgi:MFS transporter, FSR family, fosmidomycin resistance protein